MPVTNTQSGTRIDEIAAEIYRISSRRLVFSRELVCSGRKGRGLADGGQMWRGEKQAGCYMEARTLVALWLSSMLGASSARSSGIALLLVAIAATGCGRTSRALARADGGNIDAQGLAAAGADVAVGTATDVPAADVPADATADRGPAIAPKHLAEPCTSADECSSGFCADGVCCNSACTERCKTCAAFSSLGECAYLPSGVAPRGTNDCLASVPSTCGLDGTCDGAGACRSYVAGTECGGRACQGSVVASVSTCDGAGSCQPGMLVDCAPYPCEPTSGRCLNFCTNDAQCMNGASCTNASCFTRSGPLCSDNSECASGFCIDGICCNVACGGPCVSCSLVRSVGTCTPVAAGAPDPSGICRNDMASTCGQTGLCDGAGSCDYHPQGTVCAPSSCSEGFVTQVSVCDGKGTCTSGPKLSCGPFGCGPNGLTCSRGCPNGDALCAAGAYCSGDEQCTAKKTSGGPCASDHECLSGVCANGVCCDSACAGPCESCNQRGSEGQCMPLPSADGGLVCGTSTDAAED